jgi:hypothetical protein
VLIWLERRATRIKISFMAAKTTVKKTASPQPLTILADNDKKELKKCKDVIRKGMSTFLEVGAALMTIQSKSLYLDSHPTFEAFCRAEFEMGRSHAYRLIDSAKVVEDLASLGDKKLPVTEGQIRVLAALPSGERLSAWQKVIDFSSSEKAPITARLIRKVIVAEETTAEAKKERFPSKKSSSLTRAKMIAFLNGIEALLHSGDIEGSKEFLSDFKRGL